MTHMRTDNIPLTDTQHAFAAENHGLLLKFISANQLDDGFYDILVERYLKTVVKYLESEGLQRYAFSTILWRNLRSELSSFWRMESQVMQVAAGEDLPYYEEDIPFDNALWSKIEEILTRKQMEVIMLRDQGYSNREIGTLCKISEKAVEKRFSRLRKRIKDKETDYL